MASYLKLQSIDKKTKPSDESCVMSSASDNNEILSSHLSTLTSHDFHT